MKPPLRSIRFIRGRMAPPPPGKHLDEASAAHASREGALRALNNEPTLFQCCHEMDRDPPAVVQRACLAYGYSYERALRVSRSAAVRLVALYALGAPEEHFRAVAIAMARPMAPPLAVEWLSVLGSLPPDLVDMKQLDAFTEHWGSHEPAVPELAAFLWGMAYQARGRQKVAQVAALACEMRTRQHGSRSALAALPTWSPE